MRKSALFLTIISFVILSQSCSRQKGYFQQNEALNFHKEESKKLIESIENPKESVILESEPILTASTIEDFKTSNKVTDEIKYNNKIVKLEKALAENKTILNPHKLNFIQKLVLKKMQKKVANATKPVGFQDWNPFLKIGIILLGVGIVLAIFGLGAIGGISALIGLIFLLLGLLTSV